MYPWAKRLFDVVFAAAGLLVLLLPGLLIALAVKLQDGGPVLYSQVRVGRHGRPFRIRKFRSMVLNADQQGLSITKRGDARITPVGGFLRRWKLDELPQLWNVLVGEMSFVGPRPEVPRYVELYTAAQRAVLNLKPGLTDLATIEFLDEEQRLTSVPDTEAYYVAHCIPRKIELNLAYAREASLWGDVKIILKTLLPFVPWRLPGAGWGRGEGRREKGEGGIR